MTFSIPNVYYLRLKIGPVQNRQILKIIWPGMQAVNLFYQSYILRKHLLIQIFFQILSEKFFLKSCSNHFDRIFFYAYYLFSSFGLSVVRPLIWFFAFFIIASLLNGIHFINSNPNCTYFLCGTIPGDSGKSALQTAFPYLPINARTEEKGFVFHLLDTFHSLISTVLIFLFSLGIRNLLRLRTAN